MERGVPMGMFLNSIVPYEAYKEIFLDIYFVDKTLLIEELIPAIGRKNKYFCITRPRRFGKSVMANMVSAFFGKGTDGKGIFSNLLIGQNVNCMKHLNSHNVVFIDFSRLPRDCNSYMQYITRIQNGINSDLSEAYTELDINIKEAVWDNFLYIFQKTGHKFIFVIDEWDAVFHMSFISPGQQKEYLLFLKNLLKDQVYTELVYMTGVLPVAKYSSGSELNMFLEYDMAISERFAEYFGFLEYEVDALYEIYKNNTKDTRITRDELCIWYDGYHTAAGKNVYNPRSVVCALTDNQIRNYWTSSGPYDEIFYYIKNNIEAVRDDLVLMMAEEGIEAEIQNYTAASMKLDTKDEIYSAMVVYGLLAYENGKVFVPNREIMEQFRKLLMSKETLGYVYRMTRESEKMLKATLSGDTQTMADILKFAHDTESPIFAYNSEIYVK